MLVFTLASVKRSPGAFMFQITNAPIITYNYLKSEGLPVADGWPEGFAGHGASLLDYPHFSFAKVYRIDLLIKGSIVAVVCPEKLCGKIGGEGMGQARRLDRRKPSAFLWPERGKPHGRNSRPSQAGRGRKLTLSSAPGIFGHGL